MNTAPCTHKRVRHDHGTDRRYRSDGCRCQPCKSAHARYEKSRRLREITGQKVTTPAGPVRQRIHELIAAGMSCGSIAEASGLGLLTVQRVSKGQRATVRLNTARAIFSVDVKVRDYTRVSARGAARRLQALAAIGWSATGLGAELGIHPDTVSRIMAGRGNIAHTTEVTIRREYRRLSLTIPKGRDRYETAAIARQRAWARRNGWAGPMAWEDIDNDPAPERAEKYRPISNPARALEMSDMGIDVAEIARRLRITEATASDYLRRAAA